MSLKAIRIRGAREHNLKDISVEIPRDQLVVITGLSGSGKSTLAFDTIFAEGQRKYMESLSTYARQFLDQLQKPELDEIEGLPPTIAIEQRHAGRRGSTRTSSRRCTSRGSSAPASTVRSSNSAPRPNSRPSRRPSRTAS